MSTRVKCVHKTQGYPMVRIRVEFTLSENDVAEALLFGLPVYGPEDLPKLEALTVEEAEEVLRDELLESGLWGHGYWSENIMLESRDFKDRAFEAARKKARQVFGFDWGETPQEGGSR